MIPLLIGAGIAGLFGAVGTSVAKDEQKAVEETINKANRVYNDAKENLEYAQKKTESSLEKFGRLKCTVAQEMSTYVTAYNRIKKLVFQEENAINDISNLNVSYVSQKDWNEINDLADTGKLITSGAATGIAAGTAIALGAGAISIDAILGAGTMAWAASTLGVGSAASLAVAGIGGVIPGLAIVAGPALLVGSFAAYYKAEQAHEKALTALAEAEAAAKKMEVSKTKCNQITEYSNILNELMMQLEPMLKNSIDELNRIADIHLSGCGGKVSEEERNFIKASLAIAKAVKAVYYTQILDTNGNLKVTGIDGLTKGCQDSSSYYKFSLEML